MAVPAVSLSILAGILGRWLAFHDEPLRHVHTREHIIDVAFTGSFAVVILLVGVLLARGDFQLPADAPVLVTKRSLTGLLGFAVIVAALLNLGESVTTDEYTYYVLFAASVGGADGLLFGLQESYSVRNARKAERKDEPVRRVEEERARLEYLNHVLRHEVLNNISIIHGFADLALEGPEDERPDEGLETIRSQSRNMATVIQDVRTLIESLQMTPDEAFESVDLSDVLLTEIADLQATHGTVALTESDIPEGLSVRADPLLARVFGNLLSNAVEHNDAAEARVGVIVEQTPETVTVHVVDNGPGVPDAKRATLFERSGRGDHGLGLYLVSTIVDRYDGTVELTETGSEGSVFTVTLDRWVDDGDPLASVDGVGLPAASAD